MRPADQTEGDADRAANRGLAPAIVLPKGGGAISGMGEKFAANPVTGTGSLSVPIAVTPGRSGFGPQLTLSYNSGSGSGIFGLGWENVDTEVSKTDLPTKAEPAATDLNQQKH